MPSPAAGIMALLTVMADYDIGGSCEDSWIFRVLELIQKVCQKLLSNDLWFEDFTSQGLEVTADFLEHFLALVGADNGPT